MSNSRLSSRLLSAGVVAALAVGGSLLAAAPATAVPVELDGTVTLSGTPEAGSTVTAVTSGWPDGTTFEYVWTFSGGNFGGPISDITGVDETASTYVVDEEVLSMWIGVFVTASLSGFDDVYASAYFDDIAYTAELPTGPAPAADSAVLAAFLDDEGVTPLGQEDAGLPAGPLDSTTPATATVWVGAGNSFVDVYAYSTPTVLGTFPVVAGAVEVPLTAETLAALGGGAHTLVLIGQTNGFVAAVSFEVAALAATGSDVGLLPIAAGAGALLLGAALVLIRRRTTA